MKLPKQVRDEVSGLVEARADAHSYMSRSRTENREFMQLLTDDPAIGGRLADFMPKEKVRTYIKDSILNAYAKRKSYGRGRLNYESLMSNHYREPISVIETSGGTLTPLIIARGEQTGFIVAKVGSVLKWETAVRHVAEFLVRSSVLGGQSSIRRVVILQGDHSASNSAQRVALGEALKMLDFEPIFS